jgi:5'-3' exonuclease
MGITGFWSFYNECVKKVPLSDVTNKVAFVDIILYIHKYVIGIRKSGRDVVTKEGKIINHIFALSKIIKNFTDNNILPVFVFDGRSPLIKENVVEKRKDIIKNSKQKCDQLINSGNTESDEYIKHFKRSFSINSEIISECKEFLDYCGIPFVNSVGEADPQCAALGYYYKNVCSGVFSEDSDILLYGAPYLLRDMDLVNKTVSIISIDDIINFLQNKTNDITQKYNKTELIFTKENFIDFSIVMGNDYCNGIRTTSGTHRDKLFELFVLCNFNIEIYVKLIYCINGKEIMYIVPDNFLLKWKLTKETFKDVEIINPSLINIKIKKIQTNNLTIFLNKLEFRYDIIKHIIKSVNKVYEYFNSSIKYVKSKQYTCGEEYNEWTTIESKRKIKFLY